MDKSTAQKIIKYVSMPFPSSSSRKKIRKWLNHRKYILTWDDRRDYRYILRYCKRQIEAPTQATIPFADLPIWQLWLQGGNHMPPLVKRCLKSVERFSAGREVRILSLRDLESVISLPGGIIDKYKNGAMGAAHFSDIVRVALLRQYGG